MPMKIQMRFPLLCDFHFGRLGAPIWLQHGPKRRPRGPKTAPRGSKRARSGPKRRQDEPRECPRRPQDDPKSPPSRLQVVCKSQSKIIQPSLAVVDAKAPMLVLNSPPGCVVPVALPSAYMPCPPGIIHAQRLSFALSSTVQAPLPLDPSNPLENDSWKRMAPPPRTLSSAVTPALREAFASSTVADTGFMALSN